MDVVVKFSYQFFPKNNEDSDNGYYICEYKNVHTKKRITVKGYHLPRNKALKYKMQLIEKNDAVRGMQYIMESYEDYVGTCEDDVVAFLSHGYIKGIGAKTAKNVWDMFGAQTMNILEDDPEQFLQVSGITKGKLEKIICSYKENHACREVMAFLLSCGIEEKQCSKICSFYGTKAMKVIEEDPYQLLRIKTLSFDDVELIAHKNGIARNDYRRIRGAAFHILTRNMFEGGNMCMELYDFAKELIRVLNTKEVTTFNINNYVLGMIQDRTIFYRTKRNAVGKKIGEYIYTPDALTYELKLARDIVRLIRRPKEIYQDIAEEIRMAAGDIRLDESQWRAIRMALEEPFCIITGGPGSGKTTTIGIITKIFEKHHKEQIVLVSPTGRAASRIKESSGREASTINHALGLLGDDFSPNRDIEMLYEDGMLMVDEVSQMEERLAQNLFAAVGGTTHVVLIGDVDQLDSVGPGAVLRELLRSGVVPVCRLTGNHRQGAGSTIAENCRAFNRGTTTFQENAAFHFIRKDNLAEIEKEIVELYVKKVQKYGLGKVACLCPYKNFYAGVKRMNIILQERLNPHGERWTGSGADFRLGDMVMKLVNKEKTSNGDVGFITAFSKEDGKDYIEVTYYDSIVEKYAKDQLDEITLAYAMTIHKSQGSEYPCVITTFTLFHNRMLKKSVLYTALSRGSQEDWLFGSEEAVKCAAEDVANTYRVTLLAEEIQKLSICEIAA